MIAGVDEVGRGCLSGPVFSAAVILKKNIDLTNIKDSKSMSFNLRVKTFKYIIKNSIFAIGIASVKEIEKLNILNASLLAMHRAIKNLKKKPKLVLIDGKFAPKKLNFQRRLRRPLRRFPALWVYLALVGYNQWSVHPILVLLAL